MGKVADGNTVTDYDGEEIKRQFSISTALATVEWKDMKYNMIDTPGFLILSVTLKRVSVRRIRHLLY